MKDSPRELPIEKSTGYPEKMSGDTKGLKIDSHALVVYGHLGLQTQVLKMSVGLLMSSVFLKSFIRRGGPL